LTLHHIISDDWSMGVFIHELSALYQAFATGRPSPLAALPIQYADFAAWQRGWLQGAVLEGQLGYWQEQLAGAPGLLELPTDRPRPAVQGFRGASVAFALEAELTQGLKVLSHRAGVTLFMTLLGAFMVVLARYSRQEDIVVGSPIANRTHSQTEGLIGFFVNTLVLRVDLAGDPPVEELLRRVRRVALEAYAHQEVPFERVVEALQPERSLSHSPLFQVLFALQTAPVGELVLPGLSLSPMPLESVTAKFDLSLMLSETEGGLVGVWEYSTDLFEAATIERLGAHFETLLEGIVADPQRRLSELPLLPETEWQQVVVEWNATETAYPKERCIHQLFEAQVERIPEAVAVVFEEHGLSYRALDRRANQLAHHLQGLGVGPEVLVGVCLERSVEMVVGLLGILKAGGAYVPLDPAYPPERLAFMLEDARLKVLLTQRALRERLPEHQAQVVCLDSEWERLSQAPEGNPRSPVTPTNLAYVMYTSGSTGTPKGISIPHRAISRLVFNTNYIQLEPTDSVAQASNSSFDAATFEFWGALLHGAQLVGISKEVTLSLQDFAAQLQEEGISALFLTTALFNQLAREVPEAFRSVRHLMFGGEAVDPQWVREILKNDPPERLLHVYGPTESTTFATWYLVQEVPEGATTVPIGRPIANTQVYILDRQLRPVPIGVPGELYIGGDGLARDYFHRPDLTAEKFLPHPFSGEPGGRLYKTGDLVRYLPEGSLEFLGRLDHQVKVRGFRIELGEIEACLGGHPGVREVVVLAREDSPGEKRLVAYVVGKEGLAPSVSELRGFLKERLPEYMVPSAFVGLPALPLTPNGKVDRKALPAPEGRGVAEGYVPPCTPTEELLAGIWAEVLRQERVGRHDNFFALGGHSLVATQVIAQLSQVFPVKLPIHTLFAGPTVAELAEAVEMALIEQLETVSEEEAHRFLEEASVGRLETQYA
jgi:amino acid adenylation domain-containing protein